MTLSMISVLASACYQLCLLGAAIKVVRIVGAMERHGPKRFVDLCALAGWLLAAGVALLLDCTLRALPGV